MTSLCVCSDLYAYAEHMHQELLRKMRIHVQELMHILGIRISFPIFQWPFVIEVPTNHAVHTHKELVRMLSICVSN